MDLSLVSTIINLVLLGTFILSMLFGFLRGFKKSLNNLIVNVVVVILAFTLSSLVVNAIINLDVSFITGDEGSVTLSETVVNLIASNLDIDGYEIKETVELSEALAKGVMRLPAFLIILFVGLLIVKPLVRLLLNKLIPLPSGKSTSFRFIGLAVSFVSYVFIMFFVTAPFFGVFGMVNQVMNVLEQEDQPIEIIEDIDELNSGIVLGTAKALFSEEYTSQAKLISNLMAIETSHGKISIKNELDSHLLLVGLIYQNSDDNEKLTQAILDNYEEILAGFNDSEILDVSMPVVIEILRISFKDENINFDKLSNVNWTNEKQTLIDLLSAIFEFAETIDLNFEKPEEILGNPNLPVALKNIGETLNNSGLFKEVLLVYLNDVVKDAIKNSGEEYQALADIIDLTKLDLAHDFEIIGLILNDIYDIGISSEEKFNILDNIDVIERLIPNIFSLGTIKNNEQKIIEFIIDIANVQEILDKMGIKLNFENVIWETEIDIFTDVIVDILKLIKKSGATSIENTDIVSILTNESYRNDATLIIEKIADSKLLGDSIILIISTAMSNINLDSWKSEKLIAYTNNPSDYVLWAKDELLKVIELYSMLDRLTSLNFESMSNDELDQLESDLLEINKLEIISLDNIIPNINNALNDAGFEVQLLDSIYDRNNSGGLDSNKDEWAAEIPVLIDIVNGINNINFDDKSIANSYTELGTILEDMKTSYIFGNDLRGDGNYTTDDDVFNDIVIEIFTDNGLIKTPSNYGFIDENKAKNDDWSSYNYVQELQYLAYFNPEYSTQPSYILTILNSSQIYQNYSS